MKKRIGVVAFAVLMALGVAAVLQAMPVPTGYDDIYYSDATWTTQVGERFRDCDDSRFSWGVRTIYKEGYGWDCTTFAGIGTDCASGFWICDGYEVPGSYTGCSCQG